MMIVDLNLKDGSGLKLIKRAKKSYPALKILVASMYDESLYGERAINAGAMGYVCKQDDPDTLVDAINLVSIGQRYISSNLARKLLENDTSAKNPCANEPADILSDRELQVFSLIGSGLSTKEIAAQLHLSTKTIDTHRDHLKRKIGVTDNVRLVHRATEWVMSQ